jgi:hypothetical protein
MSKEISQAEVLELFRKWKANSARLLTGFHVPAAFHGQFDGFVAVVEQDLVVIGSHGGNQTNLQISVNQCRFLFPNVTGDPDSFLDTEPTLSILFPSGARCTVIAFVTPN